MTLGFRLTPRAVADIRQIADYTEKTWGKKQRTAYLISLNKRFKWLAERPYLGRHRPEIADGVYAFPQGSHIVYYQIHEVGIAVIGILHRSQDIELYFS